MLPIRLRIQPTIRRLRELLRLPSPGRHDWPRRACHIATLPSGHVKSFRFYLVGQERGSDSKVVPCRHRRLSRDLTPSLLHHSVLLCRVLPIPTVGSSSVVPGGNG